MELGDQKYSGYSSLNHFTIIFLLPLPSVDYMTTIDQIPYPSLYQLDASTNPSS